ASNGALNILSSGAAVTTINANIVDGTAPSALILTGATSGTGIVLGGTNTYTGGTLISVNTGSSQNIVLGSNSAFGTGKVTNILFPGSNSPQIQATAARTIANTMDLNGGLTWTGTSPQTYTGPLMVYNAVAPGTRTLSAGTSGLTVTLGDAVTASTITLGNPVANGGDGVGKTTVFNAAAGATLVINDVMQDPAAGGGAASGSVQYQGGSTSTAIIKVNGLSTYTGPTLLGATAALQFNHDYHTGDPSGPFGLGTLTRNSSSNLFLEAVGGSRTMANPMNLNAGFTVGNASTDPSTCITVT